MGTKQIWAGIIMNHMKYLLYKCHAGALDSKDSSEADIPFRVTMDGGDIYCSELPNFPPYKNPYLKVGHCGV